MGAHSTLRITRSRAKEEIIKHLLKDVSDSALEDFLDKILDHRLYNAVIVDDYCQENDDCVL